MTMQHAWASAAWTQLWQLTAVIVAVGAAAALCRRRPHLAYALWMIVLVKAITPPLWSSNLSALAHIRPPAPPAWLTAAGEAATAAGNAPSDAPANATPQTARASATPSSPIAASHHRQSRLPAWLAAWTAGALALSAVAAVAVLRRNRLLAAARPPDERLTSLVRELARQVGVAPPATVVSDSNLGPAVCGLTRPTLILPATVADDIGADHRAIVAHELVHLRRGDQLVVVLQFVVQAVWWFHPLVWWANRRICRVRESCCDAETVAVLGDPPKRYARALLDVLDAKRRVRPVFGFPGVRPIEVTAARVKEILAMSDSLLSRTPASYWLVALAAAALVLPAGAHGADDEPDDRLSTQETTSIDQESASDAAADDGDGEVELDGTAVLPPAEAARDESNPFANPRRSVQPVLVLKYGDGKPDGVKSIAGAGEMIRFTLPEGQDNDLKALRIHCSRYGYPAPPDEDVEINILSEDMKEVLHTELVPYSLFKRQKSQRWTMVPFKEAVDVPETFWVVLNFNAEATKGVYVSFDTSTKGKYSQVGFNDEDAKPTKDKADWMVQAVLAK